jgi:hypothetical protein
MKNQIKQKNKKQTKLNPRKDYKLKIKKSLKKNKNGGGRQIEVFNDEGVIQPVGDCVKELISFSYWLYLQILDMFSPATIICGGQSPAYYCLAMMNFKQYDPSQANIVILPHSKGGVKSNNQSKENLEYCRQLQEKKIGAQLNKNLIIIDGVHSGVGILALESAINSCYPGKKIFKFAINYNKGISEIQVDYEFPLKCEPRFSDTYPRIVQPYYPRDFINSSKFITNFNIDGNPIAEMIIDIAQNYPKIKVENTDWYTLNLQSRTEIEKYN